MRHLLTLIGLAVVIGIFAATCGNKNLHRQPEAGSSQSATEESSGILLVEDASSTNTYPEDEEESWVYYGDTLSVVGDKTYMYSYDYDSDEIEIRQGAWIVSYNKDSVALDSCRVEVGTGICDADGKKLKIAVGVDTLRYNITKLPKVLKPMEDLLGRGKAKEHYEANNFRLSDSSMLCCSKFIGYLPDTVPAWLKNFIAVVMYSDIKMIFDDFENFEEVREYLPEYEKQCANPKRYLGLNTATATPKEIARYFNKRFERRYKQEFKDEEGLGPTYQYMMEVAPAWTSDDGSLATYRFYTFNHTGGVHGMMYEFYLTFDSATGRILGIEDLYDTAEFKKAMIQLGKKITKHLSRGEHTADLGEASEEYAPNGIYYENFNGYIYPRPALLKNGAVFSYQPYDKGCFADGILHFTLPYRKDTF